ncbi:hypothetical protein [Pseudochelatococcus contaminans]|uniref:Uncharacterized protein n=1 Tax=Pseudochelatococcus contaminans TaxID=1538103 RepID=A0A7W5Z2V5_9HYPH|nr:hypothetical protein [Pseudochelatococcus contaminans]MBB3808802.1 hypothetical protein [Pseudochelatococcus contaminans]
MTDARERLARAICTAFHGDDDYWTSFDAEADSVLTALNLTPDAATALMDGTAVVVPVEPTDEQLRALEKAGGFNLTGYLDALAASPYRSNSDGA